MNRSRTYVLLCLLAIVQSTHGQTPRHEAQTTKHVRALLTTFQSKNKSSIAKLIAYPLGRPYPIPSIKNQAEMIARFEQVFDQKLLQEIYASKVQDWRSVGWRGVMLNQGTLWMDGNGKIAVVNYVSPFETDLKAQLIEKERLTLHPSIQDYAAPEVLVETSQFLIRIDALKSGYRYASWPIKSSQSVKPSLVITGGTLEIQGTMRVRTYRFRIGSYTYSVTDQQGLVIEQGERTILQQNIVRYVEPVSL